MSFSPIVWLASGIIIMACEIFIPGFIIFWFGAGGILTALFIFIGIIPENNAEWQWIFFFISSFALLGFWQLILRKKFQRNTVDVSRDATLVNLRGKAISRIEPGIPGEVELYSLFHGIKKWQAESDETIESGEEITVIDAKGIKLIVKHT
ncbi:MAG TPA: NfeD family protein [Spirochaetota bacterium]|nr:NfeD family protein [Spirochaetota bacterium]HSA14172.1 NfeD family protein [Spirochaetota bacterium]